MLMARRKDPSFFKILLGDHFCHKLKIPGAFLKYFDGNVPEKFCLRSSARTWLVAVEKVDHKYYFQKGWNNFVHENGLKIKEVLVFRYTGTSDFSVDIYGKNTCKKVFGMVTRKESDCLRLKDVDYPMEEADDPSVEILNDVPPCRTSRGEKFELPRPLPHIDGLLDNKDDIYDENESESEEHKSEEEDENENLSTEENETAEDVDCGDEDSDEENEDEDVDSESKNENEDQDEDHCYDDDDDVSIEILSEKPPCWKTGGMFPLGSQLHKLKGMSICSNTEAQSNVKAVGGSSRTESFLEQRHKIPKNMDLATKVRKPDSLERALDFESKSLHPCVVIPIRATYAAGHYLSIPSEFAKRHLRKKPKHAIFRANGVSQNVDFHYPNNHETRVGAGWSAFLGISNLKERDVCVFVLTDNIKFQFSVKIFRSTNAADSTLPSPGGRQAAMVQSNSKNSKRKLNGRSSRI